MTKWGWGIILALSLLGLVPQCNLSGASVRPDAPPLPQPHRGPILRIALLSPTTGELATFGRAARNGTILAFDEWKSHGGVLGRPIEWTVYEAACDFASAQQATQQALSDGFQFIIGPLCSEAAIAAAASIDAHGEAALLIAPTATHPLVTVDGQGQTRSNVFRLSYAYAFQGQAAAHFAFETLKARRAALLLNPGDDYSATLAAAFETEFAGLGGQVVYQAAYTAPADDFTPSLQAADAAGATVIYLPGAAAVANRVAGQLEPLNSASPSSLTLLGSDSWAGAELDLAATTGSYFPVHFFPDDQRPVTQQWVEAYKASYAVAPDTLAALNYDAATLLLTAIRQANTIEVKKVAQTLQQSHFTGVTGPISFDRQHNPLKPVPMVQVKDGQLTFAGYVDISDR
jgi:branched-chain amino acid transport system substrate-binding protein